MIRDRIKDQGLLLEYAIKNGMLDFDTIQSQIEIMERQKYLEMHKYKVWQSSNGYWYTELPPRNGEGKRVLVKKKNRVDLDNRIIEYYESESGSPTFKQCFDEWITKKLERKEIVPGTVDRYKDDFKRYFSDPDFANRKMEMFNEVDLEDFIRDTIAEKKMTVKAFSNMRTVLTGVFKYAKKRGWTKISITTFFGDLDISSKAFERKKKKSQVFTQSEKEKVIEWIRSNPSVENYGLLLAFQTGIRTGELTALKFSDVDGQWLHVQRQEVLYRNSEGKKIFEVVEYTKTEAGDRMIALPKTALETIEKIRELNPDGEFMMTHDGRKSNKWAFNKRIYRACRNSGVEQKSMHKIRKTYGTALLNSGVDEIFITKQMGHSEVATTRKYYYDIDKDSTDYLNQIEKAINI